MLFQHFIICTSIIEVATSSGCLCLIKVPNSHHRSPLSIYAVQVHGEEVSKSNNGPGDVEPCR